MAWPLGARHEQQLEIRDESKAVLGVRPTDARFASNNASFGHAERLLRTSCGLFHWKLEVWRVGQKGHSNLFNCFVSANKDKRRDCEAERFGAV